MSRELYFLLMVAVAGVVTIGLRAFPFLAFGNGKKSPEIITYIGRVLSPGAIAMLVIYCFCSTYKDMKFADGFYGIPELAATLTVVGLQIWRRNPLLSIIAGTAVYMLIIQNL